MSTTKEALERKTALEALLSSPGWDILKEIVREQVRYRTNLVMLTKVTPESALEQEFTKGEVAALRMIIALPRVMVDNFNSDLKEHLDVAERTELDAADTFADDTAGWDVSG